MSKRPNISILENPNIHVDETHIKENMLCVDTKCNCEKLSPIHTSSKDSEIYMAWATKRYSWVHSIPTAFVHLFLPVWHIRPVKPGEQKQENMLTPSLHVPPCRQGWLAHSSMPAFKEIKKNDRKTKPTIVMEFR